MNSFTVVLLLVAFVCVALSFEVSKENPNSVADINQRAGIQRYRTEEEKALDRETRVRSEIHTGTLIENQESSKFRAHAERVSVGDAQN